MNKKECLEKSINALAEYSKKHGYPTAREWTQYANENGLLSSYQLSHRTKMRWLELQKELGTERELIIRRQLNFQQERQLAIKQLQEAANALGENFTKRQYMAYAKENGYFSVMQLTRLFNGKFNNAKLAANLPVFIADDKFSDNEIISAIKECSKFYNDRKFSELEYEEWRKQETVKIPNIETVRQRLGSLPEIKMTLNMKAYEENEASNPELSEEYCISVVKKFISEMLSVESYARWAKENSMPTASTLLSKTKTTWEELKQLR